jgi:hypothetical protein
MSFDTTSSNTGLILGACTLLQQKLVHPLFHFACRHHILELVEEAAFTTCCDPSSGPDLAIFKRFRTSWNSFNQSNFKPLMIGDLQSAVADVLFCCKDEVVIFCLAKLTSSKPRDDYRDLFALVIILYGFCPPREVKFIRPGALHRVRWMSRIIYGIKLFLF